MNRPRIGFAGIGRIGNRRLNAIAQEQSAEVAAVFDPDPKNIRTAEAQGVLRNAETVPDFESLVDLDLDGIVVSSPNHLHAEQSIDALRNRMAVFCQKPLGCNKHEVDRVVDTARGMDRLLSVDLTYRRSPAMREVHRRIQAGEIGNVYAADLVFHNAYGPDKTWFYDRTLSGGGCFLDLGVHLIDLGLWMFDFPRVENISSRFYSHGNPIQGTDMTAVEDHALARLDLDSGATVQVACSWHLSTGCDAVIRTTFHGTQGTLHVYNQHGSYFDLVAKKLTGNQEETLVVPNGRWDSGMAIDWTRRLQEENRFAPEAVRYGEIAKVLDEVYSS